MAGEFDLSAFIGKNLDFARGYTFYCTLPTPITGERAKYLVKSTALPDSTIGVTEANWQGNVYKLGTTHEYGDFTVSFNVDIVDNIRKQFLKWAKKIHDVETNKHGSPGQYMQDITLEHLNHNTGNMILEYKLVKAWPSSVGEMTLDYSAKDLATFNVTFAYQYFLTNAA